MPNGVYQLNTANEHDCQSYSGGYDNSGTYTIVGNLNGNDYRTWLRYVLDIPADAVIDDARLYSWVAGQTGNITAKVYLVDDNDCDAFSANPNSRSVVGSGNAGPITWSGLGSAAASTWQISPSLAAQVQYFVNGSCTGGGYVSGQYIGFRITADGESNNIYKQLVQSNYGSGILGSVLLVAYHTANGYATKFVSVSAQGNDTYNISTDTTNDRKAETTLIAGEDGSSNLNRIFLRFNAGIPANATIQDAYLISFAASTASAAFTASLATIDDESVFLGNVYTRGLIAGQTAVNWSCDGTWAINGYHITPPFPNPIQYRVNQADYNPIGENPYIGIRIGEGDANAKNEMITLASYDHTTLESPVFIVYYYAKPLRRISVSGGAAYGNPAFY
ncbi:MAG: hypothetical protein WC476_01060 [Phycisphaerae bacterium]